MAPVTVIFLSLFLHLFTDTLQSVPADDHYIAAVVEYSGIRNSSLSPMENAKNNVKRYADIMKKAMEGDAVDIIVFPEIGLFSFDNTIFVEVPDPKDNIIPAKNKSTHEVLRNLSQAAIDNKLYVVVNLHELYKNGTKDYKYNTNVVFDRNGTVIARYRKYNLFGERYLDRTETPEYVVFNTDFGVTFGTFTCFDIVFEEPAVGLVTKYNITDIVFPTAWFSELPLYIAIQEQSAWAYATNVNMLASGYNNISAGNTGSGIYAGRKGPIVYIESESTGTKILIGKVPKMTAKGSASLEPGKIIPFDKIEEKSAPILHEDLQIYVTKLIEPTKLKPTKTEQFNISDSIDLKGLEKEYNIDEKLCHGDFCCNFNLSFSVKYYQDKYNFKEDLTFNKTDAFYHFKYRLIALDGIRQYIVGNSSGQQVCAIMPCLKDGLDSCAISNKGGTPLDDQINDKDLGNLIRYSTEFQSINISGNFHNNRVLYLPSVLLSSDDITTFGHLIDGPEQLNLNIENNTESAHVSLILKPRRFASGGIYARLFERDNKPNSANSFTTNMIISCLLPLIIIYMMITMK